MSDESKPIDSKALATVAQTNSLSIYTSPESFEAAKEMARALASSDMVPATYKDKPQNCMVALEMAKRTGSSPLAVMQSLYIVKGKPSWSGQYCIAAVNACGRFKPLKFRVEQLGEKTIGQTKINDFRVTAYTEDKEGNPFEGPPVSLETAVLEGWYGSNPKWKSMPMLMAQYRAGAFFARLHVPERLFGMQTDDEIRDVTPASETKKQTNALNERIRAKQAPPVEVVEAEILDPEPEDKFQ